MTPDKQIISYKMEKTVKRFGEKDNCGGSLKKADLTEKIQEKS